MSMKEHVVTRIAPSPTGPLHVGTARSALFNYLFAKKHNGSFIVRIEDTDTERSKKEFEENILHNLSWLGLKPDDVFLQSERKDIYTPYIQRLIKSDAAYVSKEESKQEAGKKVNVVRLRNQGKKITFHDEIRGDITFDTAELGDFVIARSETDPLYHLAVVIDDHEMQISHIIRGEDHISNTPRQILIQEALGLNRPIYAHIPLILAPDRTKLSKRRGATSISDYSHNYLPEAFVNYLALLGWNPGTEKEFFTLTELVETFSLEKIQKGGAIFDVNKLNAINQHYIKELSPDVFRQKVLEAVSNIEDLGDDTEKRDAVILSLQKSVKTFSEAAAELEKNTFYFAPPVYDTENLIPKDSDTARTRTHLEKVLAFLEPVEQFTAEEIKDVLWDYATEEGRGAVLWPLRYALTGEERSPDPFSVAAILGKSETISRLKAALLKLA